MNKQTICLAMIVKNEIHVIKESLDSVAPYIDYWVINDNGSTDGTQDFIQTYFQEKNIPGELITTGWKNFAFNRTEVFKAAEGKADYVLVMDADDIFQSKTAFPKLTSDAYYVDMVTGEQLYQRLQVFKNNLGWKYVGVLHEYPQSDIAKGFSKLETCSIESRRLGSRNSPGKEDRDIETLLQGIADEPDNARYYFYLGQTYRDARKYEEAIAAYNKRVSMGGWSEEVFYSLYQIIECIIQTSNADNILQDIIDLAMKAFETHPQRAEALCSVVKYCRLSERYRLGYMLGKMALDIPYPSKDTLFINTKVYDHQLLDETAVCSSWLNMPKETARLYEEALKGKLLSPEDRDRIEKNLAKWNEKASA